MHNADGIKENHEPARMDKMLTALKEKIQKRILALKEKI